MGRPVCISRGAVLAAALGAADENGLDGVTMPAVARRLNVTPMALYRHVRDKDDLLDGLVELLVDELAVAMPRSDASDPERIVERFVTVATDLARRHPAVSMLLLTRPVNTPSARARRSQFHEVLRRIGVRDEHVVTVERILTSTVLAVAAGQATGRFSTALTDADERMVVDFVVAGLGAFLPGRAGLSCREIHQ